MFTSRRVWCAMALMYTIPVFTAVQDILSYNIIIIVIIFYYHGDDSAEKGGRVGMREKKNLKRGFSHYFIRHNLPILSL